MVTWGRPWELSTCLRRGSQVLDQCPTLPGPVPAVAFKSRERPCPEYGKMLITGDAIKYSKDRNAVHRFVLQTVPLNVRFQAGTLRQHLWLRLNYPLRWPPLQRRASPV